MRRSQSPPSSELIPLPPEASQTCSGAQLREPRRYRRLLLGCDFSLTREEALTETLAARLSQPSHDFLADASLACRHWLIAQIMRQDGTTDIQVAEVCPHCSELLEFRLDLAQAIRSAEPVVMAGLDRPGWRLPTARDLASAHTPEELLSACVPDPAVDPQAAEQILRDADPLGTIALHGPCCQCGQELRTEIDLPARWLTIARRSGMELLEEVHLIASRYHWSERDILGLTESRRRQYIALCRADSESEGLEQQVYV
jgi:hypothetical protein